MALDGMGNSSWHLYNRKNNEGKTIRGWTIASQSRSVVYRIINQSPLRRFRCRNRMHFRVINQLCIQIAQHNPCFYSHN